MGKLLDYYQAIQAEQDANVDRAELDKEKAVEEAASLERDIDTLANNFDKAFTVSLLGPIVHVTNVADGAQQEMKVEVTHSEDGFGFDVEEAGKKSSYSAKTFYPLIVGWLKNAQ